MKAFLLKFTCLIALPLLAIGITEAALPITFFTHRHIESLYFRSGIPAKTRMYPNITSSMEAVGDLCHHTRYAVAKHETWVTDKLGFRNDTFTEQPEILFIGDSFIMGSGLSQDEILSRKVKDKLNGISVYNMASSDLNEFDRLLNRGLMKKPKVIVYSIVERNIPDTLVRSNAEKPSILEEAAAEAFSFMNINVYLDKMLKHFSANWIKGRIYRSTGPGIQSPVDPRMFFLRGMHQEYDDSNLQETRDRLIAYNNYCDSLGITFLFLPMPNKETVYYDLVPFEKQPDYLFKLDSLLRLSGIQTINTLKAYNDFRKTSSELIYHTDDTHWNSTGVELVSEEIANWVNGRALR